MPLAQETVIAAVTDAPHFKNDKAGLKAHLEPSLPLLFIISEADKAYSEPDCGRFENSTPSNSALGGRTFIGKAARPETAQGDSCHEGQTRPVARRIVSVERRVNRVHEFCTYQTAIFVSGFTGTCRTCGMLQP